MMMIMIMMMMIMIIMKKAFWLGLFATAGSSARVAGPLLVTEIYEQLGSYWMLGIVAILMVI